MEIEVRTQRREEMVDITVEVAAAVREAKTGSGHVFVYCPHTTAGLTINEAADPDVRADILSGLERLVPRAGGWRHAEGNADAHIKASLMGSSVTVPIDGGKMALGTWQGVFLCEFDGPRRRTVLVSVTGPRDS